MWTAAWASFLAPERRSVLPSIAMTSSRRAGQRRHPVHETALELLGVKHR